MNALFVDDHGDVSRSDCALLQADCFTNALLGTPAFTLLRPKWHTISYMVHYFFLFLFFIRTHRALVTSSAAYRE